MDSTEAIQELKKLISDVKPCAVTEFLGWIRSNIDDMYEEAVDKSRQNCDIMLDTIRDEIRERLPINATFPTERILTPVAGPNSDCDPTTTVHVDAFLFDDNVIDGLCDDGKMSRNYCRQCGSKEISPLTFITHSASVRQIKYMFQYLLPNLHGKAVLDVGSRTGAVLYGAYLFSDASKIVGVELDKSFCDLQKKIVEKYEFKDRIKIVHQNIMNYLQYLNRFDVIILNNVFEFFMEMKAQKQVWQSLYQNINKPGTMLITIPSVKESLQNLQTNINLSKWLKEVDMCEVCKKTNMLMYGQEDPDDKDLASIHLYEVLPRT
ncbi:uncharacterized protein LOC132562795 [Ylistrum balloti]|uniref:uncharacterized protein LOC132562795 n=1 Tax=Ylistrum balloti TaxID=509963 RepID=UPI00290597CE|nr:uncharacterized protein LOC132562795 [Ylistrum balloti]